VCDRLRSHGILVCCWLGLASRLGCDASYTVYSDAEVHALARRLVTDNSKLKRKISEIGAACAERDIAKEQRVHAQACAHQLQLEKRVLEKLVVQRDTHIRTLNKALSQLAHEKEQITKRIDTVVKKRVDREQTAREKAIEETYAAELKRLRHLHRPRVVPMLSFHSAAVNRALLSASPHPAQRAGASRSGLDRTPRNARVLRTYTYFVRFVRTSYFVLRFFVTNSLSRN